MSVDFGLAKFKFKRVDGTGEVYECPRTPAAVLNAMELESDNTVIQGYWMAYLSAEYTGLIRELDVDFAGCDTEHDKLMRFLNCYVPTVVFVDDNGKELADDTGEPNPTR